MELLELIYSYPFLERILISGLILSDNSLLKEKFSNGLSDLFRAYSISDILLKPHQFFIPIFTNQVLDFAFNHIERSEFYFHLLITTMDEIHLEFNNFDYNLAAKFQKNIDFHVDFYALLEKLVDFMKNRKFPDESQEKELFFTFSLNLIKVLLNFCPEKIEEIGINLGLMDELLFKCLFIMKNSEETNHSSYKCKTLNSRTAGFTLLQVLSMKSVKNLEKVLNFFMPLIRDSDWRTKSIGDWNITPKINEKSNTGYVGLKNLGCSNFFLLLLDFYKIILIFLYLNFNMIILIFLYFEIVCYMNSLMQQLYMIPSFRDFVIKVEDKSFLTTSKEDNVLYQLKVFHFLSFS